MARLLPPESSAVEVVSREVGVSVATLERWRAGALANGAGDRGGGSQRWTAAARLEAVIATAAMDEAVLSAWCRERAYRRAPAQIILDLDATDDPLHGNQEGRFFHGYYDCHCYLPLYAFSGRHLLAAKLRRSNIDSLGRGSGGDGADRGRGSGAAG